MNKGETSPLSLWGRLSFNLMHPITFTYIELQFEIMNLNFIKYLLSIIKQAYQTATSRFGLYKFEPCSVLDYTNDFCHSTMDNIKG